MITLVVAALICGEDIVIEETESEGARVDGEGRVTLVAGARFDGEGEMVGRLAAGLALDGALDVRASVRLFGVMAIADTVDYGAFAEPRVSLRWRRDATEVALGWSDTLRWSTLVDPLPTDQRLGGLPATDPEDRRRAIPFVTLRQTIEPLSVELLWQPWWVQSTGVDADASVHGMGAGARVRWGAPTSGLALSWLWRRATLAPFTPQHAIGFDGQITTGVVHLRLEGAWRSGRSEWAVDHAAHARGSVDGLLGVSAAPTIFLDGEVGLRTATSPDALALFARLTLLMAFDGVVRLDAEARVRLDADAHQLLVALVWRAARRAELALGVELDEGRAALYDARDQVWARLMLDL